MDAGKPMRGVRWRPQVDSELAPPMPPLYRSPEMKLMGSMPLSVMILFVCVMVGCNPDPVETYESGFSDSVRAEFDLGTGRVDHQRIDRLLRTKKIGFIDGTLWSGSSNEADYTELRIDLKTLNPEELIDELISEKMIGGDPTWFVNDVEINIPSQVPATD